MVEAKGSAKSAKLVGGVVLVVLSLIWFRQRSQFLDCPSASSQHEISTPVALPKIADEVALPKIADEVALPKIADEVALPKIADEASKYFEKACIGGVLDPRDRQIIADNKRKCGELCTLRQPVRPGLYFMDREAQVNCTDVMSISDRSRVKWMPQIPLEIIDEFTLGGQVPTVCVTINDLRFDQEIAPWLEKDVDEMIEHARLGKLKGNYGIRESNLLIEAVGQVPNIGNKHVLVLGSQNPWVEAIALAAGARQVDTLEWSKIKNSHPKIRPMQPPEFFKRLSDATLPQYDVVISYSSLEHTGLGRYGDGFDPWGDITAVAKIWCYIQKGGTMILGVPFGFDEIQFTAHRVYGELRWSYLTSNWKQVNRTAHISTATRRDQVPFTFQQRGQRVW